MSSKLQSSWQPGRKVSVPAPDWRQETYPLILGRAEQYNGTTTPSLNGEERRMARVLLTRDRADPPNLLHIP